MPSQYTTNRRRLVQGTGGLAAAGMLGSPAFMHPVVAQDGASPVRGGEAIVIWTSDFVSMDPIHSNGTTRAQIFDWLLAWRPNENGEFGPQPMLATAWEADDTGVTFTLREGVTFHDGSALTAEVVAWNIARMVQTETSFARNSLRAVDVDNPATVIDDLTVRVNLTRPSSAVLTSLSDIQLETPMVSMAAAEANGEEWLKANPVGTGPFKFESWTTGDSLRVVRNESYWQMGADGQPLPYLDAINYRIIISVATGFAELRAGTADWLRNIPGRDAPAAREIEHATLLDASLFGLKRRFFFNATIPPFQDNLALRQAFNYAIDRDAVALALGAGQGRAHPWEFSPGTIGFDESVPHFTYDPDRAVELLAESGVEMPLKTVMTVHSRDLDQQQAQIVQAMLGEIGVEVELDIVEDVAWGEQVRVNADFEFASQQGGTPSNPASTLQTLFEVDGEQGYARGEVPGLPELLQAADSTYDPAEQHDLYVEAQGLMHEAAWWCYMWFETGNVLLHNRVKGVQLLPNGESGIWGSLRESEWWIEE